MKKKYISVRELAEYTGLANQTIYHWTAQRKIPFYKFGNKVKFDTEDIHKWIKSKKIKSYKEF